jgi:FtsZ-binding cell division protein ZapB
MVTLEQVRQLETKIGKAIDYVHRVNGENARLRGELDGSQKRIAELEETVQRFREEQGRIEEGILAALDRLDQFEDAVNAGLSNVQAVVAAAAPVTPAHADPPPAKSANPPPQDAAPQQAAPQQAEPDEESSDGMSDDGTPDDETSDDGTLSDEEQPPDSEETASDEFDLF